MKQELIQLFQLIPFLIKTTCAILFWGVRVWLLENGQYKHI